MNYQVDKKLRNVIVRVPTEYSSMFYFIMESNDNVAFYSTLKFAPDSLYRDITVYCTPELSENLDQIIQHFQTKYPLTITHDELVDDQGILL
jgi:hypothetical protein